MTALTVGLIAFSIFTAVAIRLFRSKRNLDHLLKPIVEHQGLEYLSSRTPRGIGRGPFPMITGKIGAPETEILGVSGEHWEYRIVKVRRGSQTEEVWVRLYFEAFRLKEAEWRPTLESLTIVSDFHQ